MIKNPAKNKKWSLKKPKNIWVLVTNLYYLFLENINNKADFAHIVYKDDGFFDITGFCDYFWDNIL